MSLAAHVRLRRGDLTVDAALSIDGAGTLVVVGPNGAGKSTLLLALAGLLPQDGGTLSVGGARWEHLPPERRGAALVLQGGALFPALSVLDNVAFGPRARGASGDDARARAVAALALVGAADLAARATTTLSGGQAQQVELARAIAAHPALLLLDEPFADLDVAARAQARALLRRALPDLACPKVLVTHDPWDAFTLADRVVVLERGVVTNAGAPDVVRATPKTPYAAAMSGRSLLVGRVVDGRFVTGALSLATSSAEPDAVLATVPWRALRLVDAGGVQGRVVRVEAAGGAVRATIDVDPSLTVELDADLAIARGLVEGAVARIDVDDVVVVPYRR